MDWTSWHLLFWPMGILPYSLVVDRIFGIPARRQWLFPGLPLLGVWFGALGYAIDDGQEIAELVLWGTAMGAAGTFTLDAVRLAGVRLGLFPMDMPEMFGMIALGHASELQRGLMREVVEMTAELPEADRQAALEPRLAALARMPQARRVGIMSNMMAALGGLPDERRQGMVQSQMAVLSRLPSAERRQVMIGMDLAMSRDGRSRPMYGPPRGMPKVPMVVFRDIARRAMPRSQSAVGTSKPRVLAAGYAWHLLIGISFGIAYTLLVGQGSWPLAIGWGSFVWLAMMIQMPVMMPMVRFPAWFVIVPYIAHIAMIIPFAVIGLYVISDTADAYSVLTELL